MTDFVSKLYKLTFNDIWNRIGKNPIQVPIDITMESTSRQKANIIVGVLKKRWT